MRKRTATSFCLLGLIVSSLNAQTFPTSRDPYKWPFVQTSIWNMPIGSGAIYAPAGLQSIDDFSDVAPYWKGGIQNDAEPIFVALATDPIRTVYASQDFAYRCTGIVNTGKTVHWPANKIYPDPAGGVISNLSGASIQPDGSIYHFNGVCTSCATNKIAGWDYSSAENSSLTTSTGHTGGHGGSGLSGIGGSIRLGELIGPDPIRHAIKMNVLAARYLVYNQDGTPGYRWPTIQCDDTANPATNKTDGYGVVNKNNYTYMEMGTLLALLPTATPSGIGMDTSDPVSLKIFYALQDYGAYIVDNSAWDNYNICAEEGTNSEVLAYNGTVLDNTDPTSKYYKNMMKIIVNLYAITNNGPGNIGGGGTPRQPLAPPFAGAAAISVTGVTLTPSTVNLVTGSSSQLSAVVSPSNASNKNITFTSGNPAIVAVNSTGLITALSAGSATVTVKTADGAKTATTTVTVTTATVAVTGVSVSPSKVSLTAGATLQLTATVMPANATNKTVTWSSGNKAIATVSTNGLVTAVTPGNVTITATSVSGSKKGTSSITITAPSVGTLVTSVIDNFESYSGSNTKLNSRYVKHSDGDPVTLSLNTTNKFEGTYGLSLKYALSNALQWGGVSITISQNWNGANAITFWLKPDGSNRTGTIQFMESSGEYWESYFTLSGTTSTTITLPLSAFVCPTWASPVNGVLDLSSIVEFSIYVDAGKGTIGTSTIYFDNFQAVNITGLTLKALNEPNEVTNNLFPAEKTLMNVVVFPNPTRGYLTVNTGKIDDYAFIISDLTGKALLNGKFSGNTTELNVTNYPPGIYFIRISAEKKSALIKFIRQ